LLSSFEDWPVVDKVRSGRVVFSVGRPASPGEE